MCQAAGTLHLTLLPLLLQVYRAVMEALPWTRLLPPGQSFSIDARVRSCTNLTSSQLLTVRAKDAICDHVRDRR